MKEITGIKLSEDEKYAVYTDKDDSTVDFEIEDRGDGLISTYYKQETDGRTMFVIKNKIHLKCILVFHSHNNRLAWFSLC